MHQRLQELMKQCWDKPEGFIKNGLEYELPVRFDANKFAELIIKDCAANVQNLVDQRIPASEYPSRLKKHFGVE